MELAAFGPSIALLFSLFADQLGNKARLRKRCDVAFGASSI